LWDESQNFYPRLGGIPHVGMREWRWPRGGRIKFSHLQFDSTVYAWQGAQIALICFDELTHFTAHQFFYMVSRNRSTCGVKPYIRATCNPDADSWVADFLAWWIDPESGLAIPERAGVLRYYVRVAEKTIWADRPDELVQYLPQPEDLPPSIEPPRPISVTFIPATVFNNPILLRANPEYYAWLLSLPTLERERLLGGNWKIRPAAGLYFRREWCAIVDLPDLGLAFLRVYGDQAAEIEVEVHQSGRGLVLLCGSVALDPRWRRRRLHDPHDRARTRRSADPQSTGGGSRTPGLAGLARSDPSRTGLAAPPSRWGSGSRAGAINAMLAGSIGRDWTE